MHGSHEFYKFTIFESFPSYKKVYLLSQIVEFMRLVSSVAIKQRNAGHDMFFDLHVVGAAQDLEESALTPASTPTVGGQPVGHTLFDAPT